MNVGLYGETLVSKFLSHDRALKLDSSSRISSFLQMFIGGPVTDLNAPSPAGVLPDIPVQTDWQCPDNLVSTNIFIF
jgi:hypothetical protein